MINAGGSGGGGSSGGSSSGGGSLIGINTTAAATVVIPQGVSIRNINVNENTTIITFTNGQQVTIPAKKQNSTAATPPPEEGNSTANSTANGTANGNVTSSGGGGTPPAVPLPPGYTLIGPDGTVVQGATVVLPNGTTTVSGTGGGRPGAGVNATIFVPPPPPKGNGGSGGGLAPEPPGPPIEEEVPPEEPTGPEDEPAPEVRTDQSLLCRIGHCTALGPCSTRHATPNSLFVCVVRERESVV